MLESTNDDGEAIQVEGVEVQCERCNHIVEIYGTGSASFLRACATLREECPLGENNFYDEGSG